MLFLWTFYLSKNTEILSPYDFHEDITQHNRFQQWSPNIDDNKKCFLNNLWRIMW